MGATPAAPLEPEDLLKDMKLHARYAERAGRDPAKIEVSVKTPLYDGSRATGRERRRFTGSPDQIASVIRMYQDVGVSHLIFDVRSADISETLERLEWLVRDVVPQV